MQECHVTNTVALSPSAMRLSFTAATPLVMALSVTGLQYNSGPSDTIPSCLGVMPAMLVTGLYLRRSSVCNACADTVGDLGKECCWLELLFPN